LVYFLYLPLQSLISQIVAILILEHFCLFSASSLKPTLNKSLDRAYSQYQASDIHYTLQRQFPSSQKCSIAQFTEFILNHHL
jgi:hypothetical protein